MPWKERLFIIGASVVAIGTIGAIIALRPNNTPNKPVVLNELAVQQDQPMVTYLDPYFGSASATKVIVLYANYACPYCASAETDLRSLAAHHPEVKVVWKDLPNGVPGVEDASEAAHCAKVQGKFWEFHQLLHESTDWSTPNLVMDANQLGLNMESFGSCLQNHDMKPLIDRTVSEGIALGINATPTIYIGKNRYVGQLSYDQLETAIR